MPFENKNVIITGGTSGIGLSLARLLAASGANLMLLSRAAEQSADVAATLTKARKSDKQVLILKNIDISKRQLDPAIEHEIRSFNVDILINNAGIVVAKTFADQTLDELFLQIDTNLCGTIQLTKICLPDLITKESQIVFINSLAGLIALYGYTGYSASKFGMEGFVRGLTQELIGSPIHICSVYPPDTATPQLAEELAVRPAKLSALNNAKPLSADRVAQEIYQGMLMRKSKIFPGFAAKVQGYLFIFLSEIVYRYFHRVLRRR